MLVDRARRLAALANRPDDQRLAAAHIACHEDLACTRAIIPVVGEHVAPSVDRDLGLLDQPGPHRARKADRQEDEVGLEEELGAGNGLPLLVDARALYADDAAVPALD